MGQTTGFKLKDKREMCSPGGNVRPTFSASRQLIISQRVQNLNKYRDKYKKGLKDILLKMLQSSGGLSYTWLMISASSATNHCTGVPSAALCRTTLPEPCKNSQDINIHLMHPLCESQLEKCICR